MIRTNKAKMLSFDQRYRKAMQLKTAQRQRVAREVKERREELLEDLEFDRVHRVRELRQKAGDPLYQFNRLATQVLNDPENAEELAAQEIVATHLQVISDTQQAYANAQQKRAEELAQARNEVAAKYQAWRY